MKALKEWATVVQALENGNQTVLLRKGGILEADSGFKLESEKFALFPTYEHQDNASLKSQYHGYLADVRENKPNEGVNRITSIAEVLEEHDVVSMEKIEKLSPYHIWSDSYIVERMNWMPEKPMKAIFLKVYKVPATEIPLLSEYHGCKSWIELNVNSEPGKTVLSEAELQQKLSEFRRIIN
ncbi:MAG: hypothetical protein AUH25_05310 [Thaumarchaeota archaeon 13_1_40CM_38_12]|nr:MAG: hypothetical protein AUH25_05310 [Thaumarchaeota archaeon 13_1_40CM_38_12]OLC34653.1 MAG: hypothetical protein AUH84_04715 [Thaumarchaeota archaeon 13_1_40CM_4_38_7]OLC91834.1 MAG: hypothetical protein AUI92_06540 [Thaumarchaeota archaeon 13_1_40CM_3_38_6]OLD41320.1 MAG: hypothetical protein AUI60_01875 [Thaumarchaeota archaeon 13_1_40CM_2_39_4]TLY03148.1 MAG: DUF1802 family protein [Nitrososphaerota archaeon]